MRVLVPGLLALVALAVAVDAQPQDGDLIISYIESNNFAQGVTLYVDPNNPSSVNTLSPNVTKQSFHNAVRMAPNNTDVVIAEVSAAFNPSVLVSIAPNGAATTVAPQVPGSIDGIELDGDNMWVVSAGGAFLWGVDHATGKWFTYNVTAPLPAFNEVAILREQGHMYAIANFVNGVPTPATTKIYSADRSGIQSTLVGHAGNPIESLSGIEVDPKTGDFITTDFQGPGSVTPEPNNGVEVNRVSVSGVVTTLVSFGANGCKVTQSDSVWIGGFNPGTTNVVGVMHFDLSTNTVITIITLPSHAVGWPISGIEVYGSHPLTCNGQGGPGATISIDIISQRSLAGGAFYQIACSLGRRPGLKLVNGEWLHLNTLNDLFFLTAQNLAPTIFRGFSGQMNPFGSAQASIKLPASFPSNLGTTVFCAGVIYDQTGVVQVTNTHWFEL